MEEKGFFGIPAHWKEPAHPGVVKLYEDLVAIYSLLRERYQKEINAAFDSISRQIGFVVATTIPVVFHIGEKGEVKNIAMGSENLKGTLFDRELSAVLRSLVESPTPWPWKAAAGTYKIYLLWHDALSLKLGSGALDPSHFVPQGIVAETRAGWGSVQFPWECCECVHWFVSEVIAAEEAVQIEAIDRVYPELQLVNRVASIRAAYQTRLGPGVREPAHPPTAASEE
jgi:hypothetical protein